MNPWTLFKQGLMTFWYWHVRKLNALWPSITLEGKTLVIFPGVYKPIENEQFAANYVNSGDRVLDLGCGSGICAVFSAHKAREILSVDISPAAVANTRENVRRFGLKNVIVRESDMFTHVDGKFDLIHANPPYIAADFADAEQNFATSVRYTPILFDQAKAHLNENGRLLIQYPGWFTGKFKRLAEKHGFEVLEITPLPWKNLHLTLLSAAYMQLGFRSTLMLLAPRKQAAAAPLNSEQPAMKKAA